MEDRRKVLDKSMFEPSTEDEIKITVLNFKTNEELGQMVMRPVTMQTREQYRTIYNGGAGRRKGDAIKATAFLFKKAFVRFEPIDKEAHLDLKEGQSEVDYFVNETPALVDRVIQDYNLRTFPDVAEAGK